LGFGIVGLGLGLLYAIPEVIQPYFSQEATYESPNFVFHYAKNALPEHPEQYVHNYDQALADVLSALEIPLESLRAKIGSKDKRIHVYLHASREAIQGAVLKRRRSGEMHLALLDALYDENPKTQLVELVTAFMFEKPPSRILYTGLRLYLGDPKAEYYAKASALPEISFFTLEELLNLERNQPSRFPETLYEVFNSPRAPAALDLEKLAKLMRGGIERAEYPPAETLRTEAAAFVKFLIEELGGIEPFKKLWAVHSFAEGMQAIYGLSLQELDARWQQILRERGPKEASYHYLRGKSLAEAGKFVEALGFLKTALAASEKPEIYAELGAIYEALGQWQEAEQAFRQAHTLGADKETMELNVKRVKSYSSWSSYHTENLLIHYPADLETNMAEWAIGNEKALQNILKALNVPRQELPDKIVIFLYKDEAQTPKILGEDISLNWTDELKGIIHMKRAKSAAYELAQMIARRMNRALTYSRVLQRGLAFYLDNSGRDYYQEAAMLLKTKAWIPLRTLDFDGYNNPAAQVEAAAMVRYLLERYGIDRFKELWARTSIIGEYMSLESGLLKIYGLSKDALEEALKSALQLKAGDRR